MKPAPTVLGIPLSWKLIGGGIAAVLVLAAVPRFGANQTLLVAYGLIFAIAALGFNLLLGYTGLTSFGHSAFLGVGAYVVALEVKYLKINSMEVHLLVGIGASVLLAALFGFICVRYTRIFFSILTMALSQVIWSLAFKFYGITSGTDGLRVPQPSLLGGTMTFSGGGAFLAFVNAYYYYVLVLFLVCTAAMWLIVHSPFGKALQAIRDNETRAEFVGVSVWHYRWMAFLISGVFTGIAGVLWAPLNGLTSPEILYWPQSGEIVFMAVLGGFKSFSGPIIGAIAFNYLKTYAVALTEYWQFLLGAVLVLLVMVLPGGIMGTLNQAIAKVRKES